MLPARTSMRSAITPKNGLTNSVGTKFKKATKPTKLGESVNTHASHPIMTRCAQKPFKAMWRLKM